MSKMASVCEALKRRLHRDRWWLFLAVAIPTLGWLWKDQLHDRFFPKRWGEVVPGQVFRSGQLRQPVLEEVIREHGIQVIVDLCALNKAPRPGQLDELAVAQRLGVEHHRFPLRGDGTGEVNSYIGALATIERARRSGHTVLVHCSSGAQRAGGVVACYQMLFLNEPPDRVREHMAAHGWRPHRDHRVIDFLHRLLPDSAAGLEAQGLRTAKFGAQPTLRR